jgi:hypothetical protein
MTYYPNYTTPAEPPNYASHAPPYAAPYEPPMRNGGGESRVQQPGEEWVRGADGSYYPPNNVPQAPPPARQNYWE